MPKTTKRYEELSTRANNILLNARFNGDKDHLKAILAHMSIGAFRKKYKNGGKVTYWELRNWCGLGDDWCKDPYLRKPEISVSDLTLTELLDVHRFGEYRDYLKANEEIIRRIDLLQRKTKNTINHPTGIIHQGSGE